MAGGTEYVAKVAALLGEREVGWGQDNVEVLGAWRG